MRDQQQQVANFHKHMHVAPKTNWEECEDHQLIMLANMMKEASEAMEKDGRVKCPRLCRIHLMLEELAEFILTDNEVDAFDGMMDLLYVTLGTCDVHSWPASEGFAEVHRSNMTKTPKQGPRLRNKGENYVPPNLEYVLQTFRSAKELVGERKPLTLKERKNRALAKRNNRQPVDGNNTPSEG